MEFDYHTLLQHYPLLLIGLWKTVYLSAISLVVGIVLGLVACLGKLQETGLQYRLSSYFIDFFRTIPEVVLIFWVYFCLPLLLDLRLSGEACGVIALSLFSGAYLAEIFRAGVSAVPRGQVEAAYALGIPVYYIWWRVILPLAVRRMMPTFVNFLTELLKASSLLSAIGIGEMVYQASTLGANTFRYVEFLSAVAVLYFAIILPLSLYARRAEARLVRRTGQ